MEFQTDLRKPAAARKHLLKCGGQSFGMLAEFRSPKRSAGTLLCNDEHGQSMVEFALILPVLLLLATGIFIFGAAMNNYLQLTNAVSMGARTLAINAGMTLDPCALASTAVTNAAPGLNSSNLTFSYNLDGTTYTGNSCSSATLTTGAAGNLASGTNVSLTATYPLNLSIYGIVFNSNNAVLSATSTELVQ